MKNLIILLLVFLTSCTLLKEYEARDLNGMYRRTTQKEFITLCNGFYQKENESPVPYFWVNNAKVWIDGHIYNYRYEHIPNSGTFLTLYVKGEVLVYKKVYPVICDEKSDTYK